MPFGFGPHAISAQTQSPIAKALRAGFGKIFKPMTPYGPVALYLLVAFVAALLFCTLPGLMGRKKPNAVKSEAYECGVEPTSDVSGRFPVRFYLIAMLFVIFDVEAASFYPWAVQMHQLRTLGLVEMVSFVIVLAIGYAYVWKRGGFQWR
jgi:NADH-quinone oxidoreductase subunit A